jgi:hypothetical protein
MPAEMRRAAAIVFGTFEGATWDWSAMRWEERK